MAFLPEACSDSRTFFLNHSSLVRNCLRSTHITDELLHCLILAVLLYMCFLGIREDIIMVSRTRPGSSSSLQLSRESAAACVVESDSKVTWIVQDMLLLSCSLNGASLPLAHRSMSQTTIGETIMRSLRPTVEDATPSG